MMQAEELHINILPNSQISAEMEKLIDHLDHVAYSTVKLPEDPQYSQITWSDHDWMVLGFIKGELVSQLCLLKRKILVGQESILVAGLGGLATYPQFRRRGYAAQLLNEAEIFMGKVIRAQFGLLICDPVLQTYYAACGWINAAQSIQYLQDGQNRTLDTSVMILPLTDQVWPQGNIDVCGSPW